MQRLQNKNNILGTINVGKWICQLSLHLNTPASCNYVGVGFDKIVFLTISKEDYDKTIGKIYAKEL